MHQQSFDRRGAYGAFILRVALGVMFLAHGLLKVLVFTMPGTVQYFESIGLPGFSAYAVVAAELLGGAALIVGWQTRVVAALLVPVLVGATWAHAGNGWLFSAPNGGWEFPLYLVVLAVAQVLLGGGAFALDSRRDSDALRPLAAA